MPSPNSLSSKPAQPKVVNPRTGNQINADGALAKSLVRDGVRFSKEDKKTLASMSPKSQKEIGIGKVPRDVLGLIFSNAKYNDVKNLTRASKGFNKAANAAIKDDLVTFEVLEYYNFISHIRHKTIGELTMDDKDLLTFYMIERPFALELPNALQAMGLFTNDWGEVEDYFGTVEKMNEKEGKIYVNGFKDMDNKKIQQYNDTWVASWMPDFIYKFKDIEAKMTRFSKKGTAMMKLLQTIQKFQGENYKATIGEYFLFLKSVPLYQRALINTNPDMGYIDFQDPNGSYNESSTGSSKGSSTRSSTRSTGIIPEYQACDLFKYRMKGKKFITTPPKYKTTYEYSPNSKT